MSILETLRQLWQSNDELKSLIPPERVHLGPPNPGSMLLCIGFTGERIEHTTRTSHNQLKRITVQAVSQAADIEQLEQLHAAIQAHLAVWESDRYKSLVLKECTLEVSRAADSPSQLWTGEITLQWESILFA